MNNFRWLTLVAFGGAAAFACGSPDPQPNPNANVASNTTAPGTTTSTVTSAGPVTNTVTTSTTATVTGTVTSTVTVTAAVTGSVTSSATTTDGTTTGTASTTGGGGATGATATTDATSTTGSDSCVGTATATAAVPIAPMNGWVDCGSNMIGLQGAFFTYDDMVSTIEPADFAAAGEEICVSGTVAASAEDVWGAGVGFNLNQDMGSDVANAWDATAAGVSGISFNISALPAGGLVRLIYTSGGVDHCVEITATGAQTVAFSDTAAECWAETPGAAPSTTTMESVKWQVAAVTAEYSFDFCISDIAAVP